MKVHSSPFSLFPLPGQAGRCLSEVWKPVVRALMPPPLPSRLLYEECKGDRFKRIQSSSTPGGRVGPKALRETTRFTLMQSMKVHSSPFSLFPLPGQAGRCLSEVWKPVVRALMPPPLPSRLLYEECKGDRFKRIQSSSIPPQLPNRPRGVGAAAATIC